MGGIATGVFGLINWFDRVDSTLTLYFKALPFFLFIYYVLFYLFLTVGGNHFVSTLFVDLSTYHIEEKFLQSSRF